MNDKSTPKSFLKKRKFIVSLPVNITFRRHDGKVVKIPAKTGTYVVKYSDVLKFIKLRNEQIKQRIKDTELYLMANILDDDIEEWLK